MIRYAIDTNALISFFTDRNPGQQEIISGYIEMASRLECEIFIVGNVITELVYVMNSVYDIGDATVRVILEAIQDNPGFQVETWFDMSSILDLWPGKIKDFGDTILAAYAREKKYTVLTFDRNFHKQLKKISISSKQL